MTFKKFKNQEVKGHRRTQNITEECNVLCIAFLYSAILLYDFQTVSKELVVCKVSNVKKKKIKPIFEINSSC